MVGGVIVEFCGVEYDKWLADIDGAKFFFVLLFVVKGEDDNWDVVDRLVTTFFCSSNFFVGIFELTDDIDKFEVAELTDAGSWSFDFECFSLISSFGNCLVVIGVFRVCTSSIFFDVTVTDCLIEDGIGIVADFFITKRNLKRKSKLVQNSDDGKGRVNHFQKL